METLIIGLLFLLYYCVGCLVLTWLAGELHGDVNFKEYLLIVLFCWAAWPFILFYELAACKRRKKYDFSLHPLDLKAAEEENARRFEQYSKHNNEINIP